MDTRSAIAKNRRGSHAKEVKDRYFKGESPAEIARSMAIGRVTVYRFLKDQNVELRKPRRTAHNRTCPELENKTVEMFQKGEDPKQIAQTVGVSTGTVLRILERHGVRSAYNRLSPDVQKQLISRYKKGSCPTELATEFSIHRTTVYSILRKHGIKRRPARHVSHGYIKVSLTAEERDLFGVMTSNGYVLEHRLVMAKRLNRPLRSDEQVHHRNGVRHDNRVENLELRNGPHGSGAALRCASCGSIDLVPAQAAEVG